MSASACTRSVPGCHQQGIAGSKILLQQNPPVLNWGDCLRRLTCIVAVKQLLLLLHLAVF